MSKQPYLFWNRNQLFNHLKAQLEYYNLLDADMYSLLKNAVFDERWNPSTQYNGCNIVQDDLHPFLPCFIHDWRWITNQDAKLADKEFRDMLIDYGYPKWKANLYYCAVRIGYLCYYKFKR